MKITFFFVFSFVNQKFIVPLQPISVCAFLHNLFRCRKLYNLYKKHYYDKSRTR